MEIYEHWTIIGDGPTPLWTGGHMRVDHSNPGRMLDKHEKVDVVSADQLRGAVEEHERLRKAILRVIADGSANVEADELLRAAVGVPPGRGSVTTGVMPTRSAAVSVVTLPQKLVSESGEHSLIDERKET